MLEPNDYYANARNIAVDLLRKERKLGQDQIKDAAAKAIQASAIWAPSVVIDVDTLTRDLRHLFSVVVENATILEDHDLKAHIPWLPAKRARMEWRFWNRYMTYLERD